ncbi:hypothetical protein Q0A17_12865 [Citrobacter sp. S2-9]|uniref:Uncharacterized protein n=1 Tax=Citrobacter enshiensis TaxID=2971264 RepID=A0ABT8PVK8_9ENTR|nr:hypothetical protein [Citrobacter enshiensis]MDN8600294.1 hypothetical protein [Citrobacter enshiensis]
MNYSEALRQYSATHRIDSEGKCWFISGVDRDQITGDGGMLQFQVHPVDENGVVDYSVHHCRTLEYVDKLRPYRNTLKDAPESATE